jgi:hypothetical protein
MKWGRIAIQVMREGFSPQQCDDVACMTKWNALYGDFKKSRITTLVLETMFSIRFLQRMSGTRMHCRRTSSNLIST